MVIVETVLAFIILVGILVFIHELGHFLAARWTGMRADVFAVGMGPRLFGWNRRTGFTFGKLPEGLDLEGNTDYRISAFPIGGYVKILGMVDESMDTDYATRPPEPWEFRSKSTLAKTFVISAGVIMNILLAIGVFAALNYTQGEDLMATTTVGPILADNPAYKAGLREGDKIVAVNGAPVKYFEDVTQKLEIDEAYDKATLTVERNGTPMTITVPPTSSSSVNNILIPAGTSVAINGVTPGSPAEEGGLKAGDVIVAADGQQIVNINQLVQYIQGNADRTIALTVQRGNEKLLKRVKPGENKQIGTALEQKYRGQMAHVDYSLPAAFVAGLEDTWTVTAGTFGLVGKLVSGQAKLKESVGGPLMIAQVAQKTASQGMTEFLKLMAVLSVTLACMNILPIPALDGGHLVFIIVEAIIRREVPLKARMAIQQVGFALLLIFMVFVLYNDAARSLGN